MSMFLVDVSYRNALLKGCDLVMGHLFSNGHVHVGDVTQEIDNPTTS